MTETPTTPTQAELTELEIAAFMGPHIKRARIALVLIGALYIWVSYRAYGDVSRAKEMMDGVASGDAATDKLKHLVTLAYVIVVFTGISGVANILLAAIAGTKTTFAMYTAMGIFAVHTALQFYATEGVILTNWLWWITAIILGMGFQAAHKAHKLRKERSLAQATAIAA
jgi:hypothetical protein